SPAECELELRPGEPVALHQANAHIRRATPFIVRLDALGNHNAPSAMTPSAPWSKPRPAAWPEPARPQAPTPTLTPEVNLIPFLPFLNPGSTHPPRRPAATGPEPPPRNPVHPGRRQSRHRRTAGFRSAGSRTKSGAVPAR